MFFSSFSELLKAQRECVKRCHANDPLVRKFTHALDALVKTDGAAWERCQAVDLKILECVKQEIDNLWIHENVHMLASTSKFEDFMCNEYLTCEREKLQSTDACVGTIDAAEAMADVDYAVAFFKHAPGLEMPKW